MVKPNLGEKGMLITAEKVGLLDEFNPDCVIVGAGAVGLLMAVDLSRRGKRVLLIEAGSSRVTRESQHYFELATADGLHKLEGLHIGRFRALGGTTHFWGGQLVPFSPLVFSPRPWLNGETSWPINRDDLAIYYDKAFSLCGMASVKRNDSDIVDELKIDVGDLSSDLNFFFTRWTPESNFATFFASDINSSKTLAVLVDAPVVSLVSSSRGRVIDGVRVRLPSGPKDIYAKKVVLANGTIEIARLLKSPLSDGGSPLWSDYSWLGKGFMDHVDCVVGDVRPIDKKRFHELFDNVVLDRFKYQPKLKLSEVGQREKGLLGVACHFVFKSSLSENLANAKIFFKGLLKGQFSGKLSEFPARLATVIAVGGPMIFRYLRYRRIYNPTDQGIQLRLTCEQIMSPASRIHIKSQSDSLGMPMFSMEWVVDSGVMKTISSYALMVKEYLERNNIATVRLDDRVVAGDPQFLDSIDDANHHMGMARMGSTVDDGVVDRDLNVFGTENLYVAGAAVYPSTGFENPTFTAMALGLRLSDHLSQ